MVIHKISFSCLKKFKENFGLQNYIFFLKYKNFFLFFLINLFFLLFCNFSNVYYKF